MNSSLIAYVIAAIIDWTFIKYVSEIRLQGQISITLFTTTYAVIILITDTI